MYALFRQDIALGFSMSVEAPIAKVGLSVECLALNLTGRGCEYQPMRVIPTSPMRIATMQL